MIFTSSLYKCFFSTQIFLNSIDQYMLKKNSVLMNIYMYNVQNFEFITIFAIENHHIKM